ncbi:MAG: hypothetical protein LBT82_02850 [Oscillospiraceae bacterium]|jgi:hypothetical protein|nr:hypothetical protein [Oscillospiraceae bacterium]
MNEKNEEFSNNNLEKVTGGEGIKSNVFSNKYNTPRKDILAFSASRRDLDGAMSCRACGSSIPDDAIIHKCTRDNVIFNTYRLTPDKRIWRKD